MSEDKQNIDNPMPADAPEGSKIDKNGCWRNKNGQLLPGQVLNPFGAKKTQKAKDFKEAAQSHSMDVLAVMYSITMDETKKASDRIKAGDIILDRAFGKATTVVQADVGDYTPRPIILGLANMEAMVADDDDIVNSGEQIIIEED